MDVGFWINPKIWKFNKAVENPDAAGKLHADHVLVVDDEPDPDPPVPVRVGSWGSNTFACVSNRLASTPR